MARDTSRSRSRSPTTSTGRIPKATSSSTNSNKPKGKGGFKFKEKKAKYSDPTDTSKEDRHYRERSGSRERKRARREDRNVVDEDLAPERGNATAPAGDTQGIAPLPQGEEREDIDDDIAAKFGASAAASMPKPSAKKENTANGTPTPSSELSAQKAAKPKSSKVATDSGPMIVVKINDRLGTTSKVPCLASDSVGDFKKLVAMRIGRKPHEIMLKRQSERPFKDFLTLADYGVSDGVQLDLELDTGD